MKETLPAAAAIALTDARRSVPSVERVLQALGPVDLPRPIVVAEVRRVLDILRREGGAGSFNVALERVRTALAAVQRERLQPVINGTGVLLHTNFGRAPLGPAALAAVQAVAAGYSNLEFDLGAGVRGGRAAYVERALELLCAAEAATVVNNGAAALVLVLRHFAARRREVVLSRGELVQIGGGFRIPEILEASGAVLREVGTTNQTSLEDYARAIGPETGLVLKVHQSNFFMDGFVSAPPLEELAALARERGVPIVEDLGSGAVFATETIPGVAHEPTPVEALRHGVDLVLFSGDKLLGGPQAGIIAGRGAAVAALKRDPLFRALRCDKLTFAALQATVDALLDGSAAEAIPLQAMLRASEASLRARAERITAMLRDLPTVVEICAGEAEIGGGSLPRSKIPSVGLEFAPERIEAAELARRLAAHMPPVIGVVRHGRLRLDLRTIIDRQDEAVAAALVAALGK